MQSNATVKIRQVSHFCRLPINYKTIGGLKMEEYLTVKELSKRIKIATQTIYNLIHRKIFILNKHYHKPTTKLILFKWTEIEIWLKGNASNDEAEVPIEKMEDQPKSLINI
jgi:hypothetical protein